jgi:hypothetical protein
MYERLLEQYDVVIDMPEPEASPPTADATGAGAAEAR